MRLPGIINDPEGLVRFGLIADWRFDQRGGQKLVDYSGYGNHGQLGSAAGSDTSDPTWTVQGLLFGVDDYVQVADAPSLRLTNALTIQAVVYPTGSGGSGNGRIVVKNDITDYAMYIEDTTGKLWFTPGSAYTPMNAITLNRWQTAEILLDTSLVSNQTTLCVNAVPLANFTKTTSLLTSANPLYIGNRADAARNFSGTIAYLLMYSRRLTTAELKRNYYCLRSILAPRGVILS
jgi:hypothetical protein